MADDSVDLVLTDPPYGIEYQSAWRIDSKRFDPLINDDVILIEWIKESYRVLKDGCALYCFTRWDVYPQWKAEIEAAGFIIKNLIVWDRMVHGLGDLRGCYAPQYDLIVFASKGRHILKNGRPKDVLRYDRVPPEHLTHPTEKPVRLIEELIMNSSRENDLILDPFLGSGTTLISCRRTGRNGCGFELCPDYDEVIRKRIRAKDTSIEQYF